MVFNYLPRQSRNTLCPYYILESLSHSTTFNLFLFLPFPLDLELLQGKGYVSLKFVFPTIKYLALHDKQQVYNKYQLNCNIQLEVLALLQALWSIEKNLSSLNQLRRQTRVRSFALAPFSLLTSCVNLSHLLKLSVPQVSYL